MILEVGQKVVYTYIPGWLSVTFTITDVERDATGNCTRVWVHTNKNHGYQPQHFVSINCMLNRRIR